MVSAWEERWECLSPEPLILNIPGTRTHPVGVLQMPAREFSEFFRFFYRIPNEKSLQLGKPCVF